MKQQNLQRSVPNNGSNGLALESAKSEVLKAVAYALLRQVYGVTDQQKPDVSRGINFYDEVRLFEINLIKQALLYASGKQTAAATLLNLNVTTLHSKIKIYNIEVPPTGKRDQV